MLKYIGGLFLVIGTCIGGGLLALPVGMAQAGFLYSTIVMVILWIVMLFGCLYILESVQWFNVGSNMVSIAHRTLGKKGESVAWFLCLILCYSLVCAYIAGGSDVFQYLLSLLSINVSSFISSILFSLIFGFVIYKGVGIIDKVNRPLMTIKFISLFLIIILIFSHVKASNILTGTFAYTAPAISVAVTSFGFGIIIPSIYSYFDGNTRKVKSIIITGSIISLICYLFWMFVIIGSLPLHGEYGLTGILRSGKTNSGLEDSIKSVLGVVEITWISTIFISICVFTSFLGVTLSLTDILKDGFNLRKGNLLSTLLAIIPPLIVVSIYPKLFILALSYAGLIVILQQIILPMIIVWYGRYVKKIAKGYRVMGGKAMLITYSLISIVFFIICLLGCFNFLKVGY